MQSFPFWPFQADCFFSALAFFLLSRAASAFSCASLIWHCKFKNFYNYLLFIDIESYQWDQFALFSQTFKQLNQEGHVIVTTTVILHKNGGEK
jgi:hypothetical protein